MKRIVDATSREDDEVSLIDVVKIVWRGKWVTFAATVLAAAFGFFQLSNVSPSYTIQMTVAPVSSGEAPGFDQLQGLGVLSGLRFAGPATQVTDIDRYTEYYSTVQLAGRLHDKYQLLQRVFAGEWNNDTQNWQAPKLSGLSKFRGFIRRTLDLPVWAAPDNQRLSEYLGDLIEIEPLRATAMRQITMQHGDAEFGKWLLTVAHNEVEQIMKEDSLARTELSIKYLANQFQATSVLSNKQALVSLLTQQERKRMLAEIDLPLAASVFDPPSASKLPTNPRVTRFMAMRVLAGLFAGLLLSFTVHVWRENRKGSSSPVS